jgi:hypothetical protein
MKFRFFVLAMIFSIHLGAQIQWQENGIPIRQAENIRTGEVLICTDGNQFFTWSDTRIDSRGVYAQKMDVNGNLLWGDEGIEIVNADYTQRNLKAVATPDNAVIVAWKDWRNPDVPEIRIQKIDSNGSFLWDEDGIILCADPSMGESPILVNDADNGAIIFWQIMYSSQSGIYANHILSDGSFAPGWSASGNLITENSIRNVVSDNEGGAVLTWIYNDQLMIQRMDENRNFLWGNNGNLISSYDSYGYRGSLIRNVDGSYYVVWIDRRSAADAIYCQRVDQNGNVLWYDDIELVNYNGSSFYYQHSISTPDNDLIVSWLEENEPTQVIVQKVNNAGDIQWNPAGVVVSGDQNSYGSYLLADESSGCWITWMHNQDTDFNVYLQHLNSSGQNLLEDNGVAVFPEGNWQFYPSIKPATADGIYVNWYEDREGISGIFSQVFSADGVMQLQVDGQEIYSGISHEIRNINLISNANGIYFLWEDERAINSQGRRIYLQSINSEGALYYEENGVQLITDSDVRYNSFHSLYNPESNLIALIWETTIDGVSTIMANALNSSGTLTWGSQILCSNDHIQTDAKISDDSNYYYVGWNDNESWYNPANDIRAQRIDENGNLLWGQDGITIADDANNEYLKEIVGRCFIWQNTDGSDSYLYAKLVDENGNTAFGWEENGTLISELEEITLVMNVKGLATSDGYLILWEDFLAGDNAIIGQLITEEGIALWPAGGLPLVNFDGWQGNYSAILDTESTDFYLVWHDNRNSNEREIYAQRFNEDGEEIWQTGGVLLSNGQNPDLAKIGDYILLVWEFETEKHTTDIKAQLLNPVGEPQWQEGGVAICDAFHDQAEPEIQVIDAENFVICWKDNRAGEYEENETAYTSVYTQRIYGGLTSSPNEILNAIAPKLYQNYPNPFNPSTKISFSIPNDIVVELSVFNIRGQKIITLINEFLTKGDHSIIWSGCDQNGNPLSSGIYFYKIKAGNQNSVKRMLLLK